MSQLHGDAGGTGEPHPAGNDRRQMSFPRQMCAPLALLPPCQALAAVSAAAGWTASPQVNISCRDGPAKGKLERDVGGGRGEHKHLPSQDRLLGSPGYILQGPRTCGHTTTTSTPPAHHKGSPQAEVALCRIHSRCNQLLTHAPAKLPLPGTSEHFTWAMKPTRDCKAPANSNVPLSLSYPVHSSAFNSQEGFCQHSIYVGLLCSPIMSCLMLLSGSLKVEPQVSCFLGFLNLKLLCIDILSWTILYWVGFAVYYSTLILAPNSPAHHHCQLWQSNVSLHNTTYTQEEGKVCVWGGGWGGWVFTVGEQMIPIAIGLKWANANSVRDIRGSFQKQDHYLVW